MSVNIKRNGVLQKLADQTLIFQANSAETRSGTITVPAISDINGNQSVQAVFSTPMPDTDYEVIIDEGADTWAHLTATVTNKTTTGFTLLVVTLVPNMPQLNFHYTAFKLVTLEGYSLVQSKVNNPDSTPTENSTNLVTSGGVYDAIKNASSVFIGTSSEWESETSKTDYQVAILTDKPNVNAVDSTTGDIEIVANKHLVFKGTLEEWEALTTVEKKTYDEALITNDMDTGEVVNAVTNGDMRAVTSNAVYDAMNVVQSGTGVRNTSYVSSDVFYCTWFKVGRICFVNIQYSLTQLTPSSVKIITGLPRPIDEVACVGEGLNNTNASGFVIQGDGSVRTHYDGASGQFVHGTVTYITVE